MLQDRLPHLVPVLPLVAQQALQVAVLHRERPRQGLVGIEVGRDRLDAGGRAAADDRDRGRGRDRDLVGEALHGAGIGGIRAGAALHRQHHAGRIGPLLDVAEDAQVPRLAERALERDAHALEEAVEAHDAEPDRALAHGAVLGPGHGVRRPVDEVLQDIVEEAHDVLDEALLGAPFLPGLAVDRGQAAHGRALLAQMVGAGRQRDLAAQVGGGDLQAELALVRRHGPVDGVDEDDIGLAGGDPRLDDALEEGAGVDMRHDLARARALQRELRAVAHRLHEGVGQQHAMMEVEGLAVEVARRLADLDELLDLRMVDVEIDRRRPAPQRALADRQGQRIHDPDEGDDARGLAVQPDRLADRPHPAPIGADAAAARRQPDILVPGRDDVVEAVADRVEVARDRQAAPGAAVRQDRRRRHEPQAADVAIEALGMVGIVGIGVRDPCEQRLVGLAGQQVAVVQRRLAEVGQQRIPRRVDRHASDPERPEITVHASP